MRLQLSQDKSGKSAVFVNPERVDERDIFSAALKKLRATPAVSDLVCQEGPSADYVTGRVQSNSFTLIYDFDYGASVRVDNPESIKIIKGIFES